MKSRDISLYKETYDKYLNLKLAAKELSIPWQTLYYYLNKVNHPAVGDKLKYGCRKDRFAREAETLVESLIPNVRDLNKEEFQSKFDFYVGGLKVDVKASTIKDSSKRECNKNPCYRWAFNVSAQKGGVDFFICLCYSGRSLEDVGQVSRILLIPEKSVRGMKSISVSTTSSKWYDFEVTKDELRDFFS